MKKTVTLIFAALTCLVIAQLGLSFWFTLVAGGERWTLKLYNPMVPNDAIDWLVHASAIALVMTFATMLRHRWGFGTLISPAIASVFGIVVLPIFLSIEYTVGAGELEIVREVLMTRQALTTHAVTATIAAMLGVMFGRDLTISAIASSFK